MTRVFKPNDEAAFKKLAAFAAHDRESFRLDANQAYKAFTVKDRALVKTLSTKQTDAYNLLSQWKADVQPLFSELEIQRTKPMFYKALEKYLILDGASAQSKADLLINERRDRAIEQLITAFYPLPYIGNKDIYARQRTQARQLFVQTEQELEALHLRYVNYLIHHEVASFCSINVVDPYDSWLKQHKTARRIHKERKSIVKNENNRLRVIDQQLASLAATYDGLVGEVIEKNWDFVVVISLRNQYEKQLQALPETDTNDAANRLVVFEKVTKPFRDSYLQTIESRQSLTQIQAIAEDANKLLLRIFSLSNSQKNQLLILAKNARELTQEKAAILKARAHRQDVLQR